MSKILVNYNFNKSKDKYTILDNDCVFADLPVAVMESEQYIHEPLVVPINNVNTVVDKAVYMSKNKKFKLALDEKGNVIESAQGAEIWLPKDTNVEQLAFVNGQLVKKEIQEEPEDKVQIVEDGPVVEEGPVIKEVPKKSSKGGKK